MGWLFGYAFKFGNQNGGMQTGR